jgi:hypothetical protein
VKAMDTLRLYRKFIDNLSEMVEEGRCSDLRREDYNYLVETLERILEREEEAENDPKRGEEEVTK